MKSLKTFSAAIALTAHMLFRPAIDPVSPTNARQSYDPATLAGMMLNGHRPQTSPQSPAEFVDGTPRAATFTVNGWQRTA